jgi:di/tricarboxylate transporter
VELSRVYIVFLFALELKYELAGVLLVAAGFVVLARRVLVSVDWTLLLVFMAMFIDVHLLIQLPVLQNVLHSVSTLSQPGLWLTAIGLSQFISNVPSTILLLNYVPPDTLLAWAVNIGGLGCCPARWQT